LAVDGVQEIVAPPDTATALTELGALGAIPVGITEFDEAETAPVPSEFEAVTLNV